MRITFVSAPMATPPCRCQGAFASPRRTVIQFSVVVMRKGAIHVPAFRTTTRTLPASPFASTARLATDGPLAVNAGWPSSRARCRVSAGGVGSRCVPMPSSGNEVGKVMPGQPPSHPPSRQA